jgi:F-type H+-transporting ATPase subunit b
VSINATLLVQMLVFGLLVWFTMKFVWPIILGAMAEREKRIADGLAAADKGQSDLENAKGEADAIINKAREHAREIVDGANSRASDIVDEGRSEGSRERQRQLDAAQAEIEQEASRVRDQLRAEVAGIAVAGAERLLGKEINADTHRQLLDSLAAEL